VADQPKPINVKLIVKKLDAIADLTVKPPSTLGTKPREKVGKLLREIRRALGLKEKKLKACPFNLAWLGTCGKPGTPFCKEHSKKKCSVCGKQADRECSHAVSLVCGMPLCKKCRCRYHG
jgi:hypothetical protein